MKLKFKIARPCALALSVLLLSGCGGPNPGNSEGPDEKPSKIIFEMPATPTPTEEPTTPTPNESFVTDKDGNLIDLDYADGYRAFYETFENCEPWDIDWEPDTLAIPEVPCMSPKKLNANADGAPGLEVLLPDAEAIRAEDGTADLSLGDGFELDCREYRGDVTLAKMVEGIDPYDDYFDYDIEGTVTVGENVYEANVGIYIDVDSVWDSDDFCDYARRRITANEDNPDREKGTDIGTTYYMNANTIGAAISSSQVFDDEFQLSTNISKYLSNEYKMTDSTKYYSLDVRCLVKISTEGEYNEEEMWVAAEMSSEFCYNMYDLGEDFGNVLVGNLTLK